MPYDVEIDRLPVFALFDLQGPSEALQAWTPSLPRFPVTANTRICRDRETLCHIGPNRWLLRAPVTQETDLLDRLRPADAPPEVSIVRVSDTLTFFRITGPDAPQVMSIGCPLDLHPDVFGAEAVSFTEFFGLRALVMRWDGGFDCAVEQSFGDMIADCLSRTVS